MNYCSDCNIAHEEGKYCPLCEAKNIIADLEKEIEKRDSAAEETKPV